MPDTMPINESTMPELLRRLGYDQPPAEPKPEPKRNGHHSSFEIDAFLACHKIEVKSDVPHDGGRKIILAECVFDSAHKAPDAAVFVGADGKLGYKCFHSSCAGLGWRELREKLEPRADRRHQQHRNDDADILDDLPGDNSLPSRNEKDCDGLIPLGNRDPQTGKVVLSSQRTLPTAVAYLKDNHQHDDGFTLRSYAGGIYEWTGGRYVPQEDDAVKGRLHPWLHNGLQYKPVGKSGVLRLVPFGANPTTVKAALDTLKTQTHLSASIPMPSWIDGAEGPPADEILLCKSSLWHLPTNQRLTATPRLFATNALDFDHDPQAPPPMEWLTFLHQLFDGDIEALDLLQEWFGYCLTAGTKLQKMLLIVGPKRSGKGTIARVQSRLVGTANVCGPTTESLARQFGLQPLINKTLAIVSDARFHGENIPTVVERLLCISGEDSINIPRKFLGDVTLKLPTRFMFLTNEMPKMQDSSGALAGRFMILVLTESFYGNEDTGLTDRLLGELPGILNWAIEGWHRLHERGRFVMPESSKDVVRDMEDLGSPVGAFVRERCVVEPGQRISVDQLYEAWRNWCSADGRTTHTLKATFGKDLAAAVPGVRRRRGTDDVPFYEGIMLKWGH